tara:strand:- start:73 stop:348 length:276 start_codon:yes stop_codon:yes gene_type:complete
MAQLNKEMFSLSKCKTKATYSAKPKKQEKINLNKIKQKFEVVLETPILLVIKIKDLEVIVHQHGELLFKKCEDLELMEEIAGKIYSIGISK